MRREKRRLEMENEILKRVAEYFVRENVSPQLEILKRLKLRQFADVMLRPGGYAGGMRYGEGGGLTARERSRREQVRGLQAADLFAEGQPMVRWRGGSG